MSFGLKFFVICAFFNLFVLFCIGVVLEAVAEPVTHGGNALVTAAGKPATGASSTGPVTREAVEYMVDFEHFPPEISRATELVRIEQMQRLPSGREGLVPRRDTRDDSTPKTPSAIDP